ncbi:VirB3 family type IV secretion system protein [uncultured Selenomonas sp.]|jgi:hypothetical protein|uniref:VirB3 family type IV secretion system protein n=1 Tax=uncultured Selenomonas sp. TaxID=159275 RepID=UPI0028E56D1F|nr:VirB3 family type IV secretion system protein [uncultured Selenomonas sp.]
MAKEEARTFSLPLYRALTEQILMLGAPPQMIVFNAIIFCIFVFSFHFFWIIPLNVAIHVLIIYVTKKDPQAFECLVAYLHQRKSYHT